MSVIKLNFEKPVQQFEINGQLFELPYDDDSLKSYQKKMREFSIKAAEYQKLDLSELSEEEEAEEERKAHEAIRVMVETFFGKGSFDKVYEASGRSLFNLFNVIEAIGEFINEKMGSVKQKKRQAYTKKK